MIEALRRRHNFLWLATGGAILALGGCDIKVSQPEPDTLPSSVLEEVGKSEILIFEAYTPQGIRKGIARSAEACKPKSIGYTELQPDYSGTIATVICEPGTLNRF